MTAEEEPRKHVKIGIVAVAVVAVAILAVLLYVLWPNMSSPISSLGSQYSPRVYNLSILAQGASFIVNVGGTKIVNFTIPQGSSLISVAGAYASSPGTIEVAIGTPSQYTAFVQNPSMISGIQYYYGNARSATISAHLSPGQYVLVFYNPGLITQNNVTISSQIVAHYAR